VKAGAGRARREAKPRIAPLPRAVREELDRGLTAGELASYAALSQWLKKHGFQIRRHTVVRKGNRLEHGLAAVRMATAQARTVVAASAEGDADMNETLLRMVQQHLFSVLVELTPEASQASLSVLTRCVAEMGRAALAQKKFAEEQRGKIEARLAGAAYKVVETARADGNGLTAEAEDEIRRTLMEVTQ